MPNSTNIAHVWSKSGEIRSTPDFKLSQMSAQSFPIQTCLPKGRPCMRCPPHISSLSVLRPEPSRMSPGAPDGAEEAVRHRRREQQRELPEASPSRWHRRLRGGNGDGARKSDVGAPEAMRSRTRATG